jgi:GYF domain 2
MSWYFVRNQSAEGPVSEAEFAAAVANGEIVGSTLVWREGWPNWVTWESHTSEAGQWTPDQYRQADLRTPVGEIWERSWSWFWREPGSLLGYTALGLLLFLIVIILNAVLNVLLPVVGSLFGLALIGPVNVGLWYLLLERYRGRALDLKNLFRGFGPRFPQLMIFHLLQSIVMLVIFVPTMLALVLMIGIPLIQRAFPEVFVPEWSLVGILAAAVISLVGVSLYFYVAIAWLYAPLLILDKGLDFWPAMQLSRRVANRHPWGFSWFLLVVSVVAAFGALLLGVGVLLTVPLSLLMVVVAYERQFGQLKAATTFPQPPAGTAEPGPADPGSIPPREC